MKTPYRTIGKWLFADFWLSVFGVLCDLASSVVGVIYGMEASLILKGISAAAIILSGLIYVQVGAWERKFEVCGYIHVVVQVTQIALLMFGYEWVLLNYSILFTLPELVAVSYLFAAYSSILFGVHMPLSRKWEKLWKWFLGCYIAQTLLTPVNIVVGILNLIATLGGLVCAVLQMVYQFQSARALMKYDRT